MTAVVVYSYGIPKRLHGADVTVPTEVEEQLRLAHELREDLVTLEHQRQERTAAVWSAHPRIAHLEAGIAEAEHAAECHAAAAAKERSAARRRGMSPSSGRLTQLRAEIRALRAERRAEIARVRESCAEELAAVTDQYRAAAKDTYHEYCQVGALYWATYNDVSDHHRAAVKRMTAARKEGRAANLRHHRFDGSGSIAVQLRRQTGMPPRTPATVADGAAGRWRNVLRLTPWVDPGKWAGLSRAQQRRRRLGLVVMCVGGGRRITLPVLVHRMLPADADITGARLVVRRVAGHRKIELHVTARVPDPAPGTGGPVAAVHMGWRRDDERGSVRVATWRSTEPVTVPPGVADVVAAATPTSGEIVVTGGWHARIDAHDTIRSDRDTALDKLRAELVAWLTEHPQDDERLTPARVAMWQAPGRFARLALDWRETPPVDGDAMAASLEAWRVSDRRLWESEAHGRAGALAARDDAYRRVTSWLTGLMSRVVVDDTSVAELARRPDPQVEPDQPTPVERRAARQRALAAPGRLRELLVSAARTRGVEVATVGHTGTTRTHYTCGYLNPADGRYAASRLVACDGCGASYDQDASATMMMLAASGDMPTPGGGSARKRPDMR